MKTRLRDEIRMELDRLIEKWQLHACVDEPVEVEPVIEAYRAGYRNLTRARQAVTFHWSARGLEYYRIVYDSSLRELSASARKRHAGAHELGHIVGEHQGTLYAVGRTGRQCRGLERWIEDGQELECEMVAAYLLVPPATLDAWAGYDSFFIARKLDVPEHLIVLRRDMLETEQAA